jgi:hypothetical protein
MRGGRIAGADQSKVAQLMSLHLAKFGWRVLFVVASCLFLFLTWMNWRIFPSPGSITKAGSPQFLIYYPIFLTFFSLLPAYGLAALLRLISRRKLAWAVDLFFAILVLAWPYLLMLNHCENFSAGISEGETIKNCVRTELGWRMQRAETLQSAWQMLAYLSLCFVFFRDRGPLNRGRKVGV